MSKKSGKKNKSVRPPLSFVDKTVYYTGLFLSIILSFLLIFLFEDITESIVFKDPSVIAYNLHTSSLLSLPLLLYIVISALVFFVVSLESKKPIFGNKNIKYGKHPWPKDFFPLFDPRRKNVYVRPSEKRFRRNMLTTWLVGLFLCALMVPFSFYGRDCLTQNNSIITYNMINQERPVSYTASDFSELTIKAKHVSGYRSPSYWKFEIEIETENGKSFTFSNRDFDFGSNDAKKLCIETMLEIKSLFSADSITIEGAHNIDKVIEDLGLNGELTQLLYELFQ